MAQLRRAFDDAGAVDVRAAAGRWVMTVKRTPTNTRNGGGPGRGEVLAGADGVRRDDLPGRPLEWTLELLGDVGARFQALSHHPWRGTPDTVPVRLTDAGELGFEKDYGGDSITRFRCRGDTARLVCLEDGESGGLLSIVEFRRPTVQLMH
jgi:hypothetical protein